VDVVYHIPTHHSSPGYVVETDYDVNMSWYG
jgi:ribonucleotide monophosphatase NagD (HAD superfamily)